MQKRKRGPLLSRFPVPPPKQFVGFFISFNQGKFVYIDFNHSIFGMLIGFSKTRTSIRGMFAEVTWEERSRESALNYVYGEMQ